MQLLANKSLQFSDGEPAVRVDIDGDGRITLYCQAELDMAPPNDRPARDDFWEGQLPELRSLAETADREKVRMAARAVLRFAEGMTMAEAAEPTPHRAGWIRGLRECVREEGIEGLKHRNYRPPRSPGPSS